MAKIYLVVVKSDYVVSGVLDLENLPIGITSDIVKHPWQHGADIMSFLQADLDRTILCLRELGNRDIGPVAIDFFSNVASLWENLPPPTDGQAKDGCFGCIDADEKETHFIRTSPEIALKMYRDLRNIHK